MGRERAVGNLGGTSSFSEKGRELNRPKTSWVQGGGRGENLKSEEGELQAYFQATKPLVRGMTCLYYEDWGRKKTRGKKIPQKPARTEANRSY